MLFLLVKRCSLIAYRYTFIVNRYTLTLSNLLLLGKIKLNFVSALAYSQISSFIAQR